MTGEPQQPGAPGRWPEDEDLGIRHGPADARLAPRYTGVRTFARCPNVTDPEGVDIAVAGVPFDTATSFRPGARFGPEGIRSASTLLRPYHPPLRVDVFERQSVVDWGDLAVTPGNAERTAAQIHEGLRPLVAAGVTPLVLGGDHSVVLGKLRAHAERHGPLGVVLIDAHADTWDQYYGERYFHGTPFRRAVEEGVLDPRRSVQVGLRGSLYSAEDEDDNHALGFRTLPARELGTDGVRRALDLVGEVAGGALYVTVDVDVLDPAFAPGTGTPEVGGLSTRELLGLLAGLPERVGPDVVAADVVEVSPPYDPGGITALAGANIAYQLVTLLAARRG